MRARYCRAASVNRRFLVSQYFAFAFPIRACAASGAHAGQYTFPWSHGLQINASHRHFRQRNDRLIGRTASFLPARGWTAGPADATMPGRALPQNRRNPPEGGRR